MAATGRRAGLRRFVDFSPEEWRVLLPLCLVGFFESYDLALLSIGAPPVYRGLGVSEEAFGIGVAVIRTGALLSVFVLRLADFRGRKALLTVSIVAFTVTTGLTALAWTLAVFVVVQLVARAFLTAEGALASIVIAEEVRPDRRGAALSLLGVLAEGGYAAVAVLLLVVPHTPLDWRLFYVAALGPLLFVAWVRRNLGETRAFTVARDEQRVERRLIPHLAPELRPRLRRAVVVFSGFGLLETAAFFYSAGLAQNEFGWQGLYTLVLLGAAPATLVGYLLGGRGSDRWGRRPVQLVGTLTISLGAVVVFTEERALYAPGLYLMVVGSACVATLTFAYVSELFPTEVRATVASSVIACRIFAGSVGLVAVGLLSGAVDPAVSITALAVVAAATQVLLRKLPETAGTDVIGARAP